jgi:hypothetical protein
MDKRITFRFYRATRHARGRITLSDALTQIANVRRPRDRERQLAQDYYVRAEIIEIARGSIHGEFTRIQKTNLPSEVEDGGRRPLTTRNPLGHGIVFRYLPGSNELGLQYDPRVISPSKLTYYIGQMIDGADFTLDPIVRTDMWDKFNEGSVRRLSITIASPTNLEEVERGHHVSLIRSMRDMGEAYDAPTITIDLSMGHKSGSLGERVRAMAGYLRRGFEREHVEISKMKAKVKQEGERTEDLDLLEDILSIRDDLELVDNDPEANYRIKLSALREKMREWVG